MHQQIFMILMIGVTIVFIVPIVILMIFLFKQLNRNSQDLRYIVPEGTKDYSDEEILCPVCHEAMISGYSITNRGIIFHERNEEFSLLKAMLNNQLLKNTADYSFRFRPRENQAWRCHSCQIVLIDHSKLLEVEKAKAYKN